VSGHPVVLLHGLGRTPASMRPIERALRRRGHGVHSVGYPSRRASIAAHSERVAGTLRDVAAGRPVHLVTHSLGGIVLRLAVARALLAPEAVGRVVMLAPPNQGSELVDALRASRLLGRVYRHVMGPAGMELGTLAHDLPRTLPPVPFELGVIAGRHSLSPWFGRAFPAEHDGKVSVAATAVAGMRELIVVPHSHTFLMRAPSVIAQVLHFLEHGRFRDDT
jgi:pimeloyl-ACP methyl ester carboxylesterase